ncbi:MAG: NADH-quinone oxidoreductase subunit L [Pseudomonadales bacterium]|nr:NADH-quinone oxidoreductase subunit L [Pseudomonadales bacterium]
MDALWLIPTFPLLGFLVLFLSQGKLPKVVVAVVGAGSIGLAAIVAVVVGKAFVDGGAEPQSQQLWTWMRVGEFVPEIRLYLDGLALVMTGVITGVGFLIHLYATGYMWDDPEEPEGFSRFFAYMNLFVFAMLMLVLGDNLLVLFLGWEGVGLCSYLLIGFYHRDPNNGYAARKAFVVTRVGDTFMALGLFLLFRELGTTEIQASLTAANVAWPEGSTMATVIGLLFLGGAMGKSAQVPLQTWLPDAMAGPTPVSALIHAATMVTAGVYLIARMHDIYLISPEAQFWVAVTGLVTLFISSFTALVQTDIKRVLAFSTMSQIGYMIMALGVGAWSAAIFHLMTHAFFKALLFLASGSVILALHHEQDMFKMGGLWRKLPIPFVSMLVGSVALAALPLTSGFFSKDAIMLTAADNPTAGMVFWGGAAIAAFMTALYTTRMILLTFFGEAKTAAHDSSGWNMNAPLVILCGLALGGGWFGLGIVSGVLPDGGITTHDHFSWIALVTMAMPLLGIITGWFVFGSARGGSTQLSGTEFAENVRRFWYSGWGFDWLYDRAVVAPFVALARMNKNDFVDLAFKSTASIARGIHHVLAVVQNGRLRWYAWNMVLGLAFVVVVVMWEVLD